MGFFPPFVFVRCALSLPFSLHGAAHPNPHRSRIFPSLSVAPDHASIQIDEEQPPDAVFPSVIDTDSRLVDELREGGRSEVEAKRVLDELGRACSEAAVGLEALLEVRTVA